MFAKKQERVQRIHKLFAYKTVKPANEFTDEPIQPQIAFITAVGSLTTAHLKIACTPS